MIAWKRFRAAERRSTQPLRRFRTMTRVRRAS
jgi:hypothetical protein